MARQSLIKGYRIALVVAAGMAAALTVSVAPAQAAVDYPICLRYYGGHDLPSYDDCSYTSIAQCNQTARGLPAQCLENPFYGVRGTPAPQPYRAHRHHSTR
jgi:hypothetical protein